MPPLHLGEWRGSWSPCTHAMLRGRGSCPVLTAEPQSGGAGDGVRARMGGGGGAGPWVGEALRGVPWPREGAGCVIRGAVPGDAGGCSTAGVASPAGTGPRQGCESNQRAAGLETWKWGQFRNLTSKFCRFNERELLKWKIGRRAVCKASVCNTSDIFSYGQVSEKQGVTLEQGWGGFWPSSGFFSPKNLFWFRPW